MHKTTTSRDGTPIAYEQLGAGEPVVLVDGAFCHRAFGPAAELAALLAKRFRVYHYDRRGRGDSGDTAPYAIEREIEDLEALIAAAGGSAFVYGISSGAALALRAAASGMPIRKLALYEAPFVVDDSRPAIPADYGERIKQALAENRRGDAIKLFMREAVGLPAPFVWLMRMMPAWSQLKAAAPTLVNDYAILGDSGAGKPLPSELQQTMAAIAMPTLVMGGAKSPAWLQRAVETVADGISGSILLMLKGQTHQVSAKVLAPVLEAFFSYSNEGFTPASG
jgi:pimeloyl-ACP methyl ester carboxylesterase